MKTKDNYLIALKVPVRWKAPWRMPLITLNAECMGLTTKKLQPKLEKALKDFQDIFKKHWLHD